MTQRKIAPQPDALDHFDEHCAFVKLAALFIDRLMRPSTLGATALVIGTYMYGPPALRALKLWT